MVFIPKVKLPGCDCKDFKPKIGNKYNCELSKVCKFEGQNYKKDLPSGNCMGIFNEDNKKYIELPKADTKDDDIIFKKKGDDKL